jgi:hypothetical protein
MVDMVGVTLDSTIGFWFKVQAENKRVDSSKNDPVRKYLISM